jgi:hypothetical protein
VTVVAPLAVLPVHVPSTLAGAATLALGLFEPAQPADVAINNPRIGSVTLLNISVILSPSLFAAFFHSARRSRRVGRAHEADPAAGVTVHTPA